MTRIFAASTIGLLVLAGCTPMGGSANVDANVNAEPVERIAEPTDGFENEITTN